MNKIFQLLIVSACVLGFAVPPTSAQIPPGVRLVKVNVKVLDESGAGVPQAVLGLFTSRRTSTGSDLITDITDASGSAVCEFVTGGPCGSRAYLAGC